MSMSYIHCNTWSSKQHSYSNSKLLSYNKTLYSEWWWSLLFAFLSVCQDSAGRVHVEDGVLVINEIMPSDGGLYSCMAVSTTRNASRDVAIHSKTSCPPLYFSHIFLWYFLTLVFPSSILLLALWPTANPGPPHYLSVSPGPTSVLFSLKALPPSGGTEITSFVLQWRQRETDQWEEITEPASGRSSALHRNSWGWKNFF